MVGKNADLRALVLRRYLEMINLDKVITKKEVVAALCLVLGKPALNEP